MCAWAYREYQGMYGEPEIVSTSKKVETEFAPNARVAPGLTLEQAMASLRPGQAVQFKGQIIANSGIRLADASTTAAHQRLKEQPVPVVVLVVP